MYDGTQLQNIGFIFPMKWNIYSIGDNGIHKEGTIRAPHKKIMFLEFRQTESQGE